LFFHFWILSKYAFSWRRFFDTTTMLTVGGITIGVAVLVVAMSSFSGFQTTLKNAIIEVVGDVAIYKRGGKIDDPAPLQKLLEPLAKDVKQSLLFLTQESLVSKNGKVSAVLLQGVEKEKVAAVLNLKNRIVEGKANWDFHNIDGENIPPAFLGQELMKKMNLKVGDTFKIVLPRASKSSISDLNPIIKTFYAAASLDLGKYDFNSRFVITDLPIVQGLLNTKNISGIRYKLKDSDKAEKWASKAQEKIGWTYAAVDWGQTNKNYLSAIEYEKTVMFFVVLIIVIAACFNVATTLFVTVLKRYRDISLLKTLGASPFDIVIIFCLHGLFLGVLGVLFGLAAGVSLCFGFEGLQKIYPLLPSDVYKLSFVATELRLHDIGMIAGVTLAICFLATLIPSIRGSLLSPVEGLKYE
jgi:lipoprotein-releasing system permease protein